MALIDPYNLNESVFRLLDKDWMLITAGKTDRFNMMTASWGGFGILWNQPVSYIFVRPTRYTYKFIEENESFTLNFFGPGYRKILNFCGSRSGREVDKINMPGLTPVESDTGSIYFSEARIVMECRKIYFHDIKSENFIDLKIESHYPKKDYHRMYIGKIENIWIMD
jgi:flavin reductase (DIM6/NTAB) family NADH-FMN oxidoreductase RutF